MPAGDIGAVAKLASTTTGDTLAPRGKPVRGRAHHGASRRCLPSPSSPARRPTTTSSATALHRLQEEDPALVVDRDEETHQTLLRGTGETHLQITLERLSASSAWTSTPRTCGCPTARRSPARPGVEGKHKKQSGGHGQFGVAIIRVEPLERGAGFEFVDKVVGGAIPRQYIPAVQKGIAEAMAAGGVFGHPVVDVRVELTDGKEHTVDSSEMAFKIAGRLAIREALAKADPVLLEPISLLEVTVPTECQGDVMGDLNARRGRVQGTEAAGDGEQTITALVPTSEIMRYAIDLRSLTGGRGVFSATHDHYDVLPAHLVDKVRREARRAHQGDQCGKKEGRPRGRRRRGGRAPGGGGRGVGGRGGGGGRWGGGVVDTPRAQPLKGGAGGQNAYGGGVTSPPTKGGRASALVENDFNPQPMDREARVTRDRYNEPRAGGRRRAARRERSGTGR